LKPETLLRLMIEPINENWQVDYKLTEENMSQEKKKRHSDDATNSEPQDIVNTLDIDGQRPIASGELEVKKTLDVDGHRPVDPATIEVQNILEIDGERPIAKSETQVESVLEIDGERPIAKSKLPIDEHYSLAGDRPIATNQPEDTDLKSDYID